MDDIPIELREDVVIPPVPKIPQNEETLSRMSRISLEMEQVENALKLLLKSQMRVTTAEEAANLRSLVFEIQRLMAEVRAIEQQLQMVESEDSEYQKHFDVSSPDSEALRMDSLGTPSSYLSSSRRGEIFKPGNSRSQSSPALAELDEGVRQSDEMSMENKGMWTPESNVWDLEDLTQSEGAIDHHPTTEIQSFFDSFVKHGAQSGSSQVSPLRMTPDKTPLDVRLGQASGKDSPWALGKTRSRVDVSRRLNRYNSMDSEFRPILVGSMAGNESGQPVSIPFVRNASQERSSTGEGFKPVGARSESCSGGRLARWLHGLTLPGRRKQAGTSCENEAGKVLSRVQGKLSHGLDSSVKAPEGSRRRRKWSLDFTMISSKTPLLQENEKLKPLRGKLGVGRQSVTLDSSNSLSDSETSMGSAAPNHFDSGASAVPRSKNSPLFRGLSLPVHFGKAK